jgi:hypothetical protein
MASSELIFFWCLTTIARWDLVRFSDTLMSFSRLKRLLLDLPSALLSGCDFSSREFYS